MPQSESSRTYDPSPDQSAATKPLGEADRGPSGAALDDRTVRTLVVGILGVILLFLVAIASAILLGFLRPPQAPRTLLEHDLSLYGGEVQSGKADAQTAAKYVNALVDAGQYANAQRVLAAALKSAKTERSYLLVGQARLEFVRKDFAACAKTADQARAEADKELQARLAQLKEKAITPDPNTERPTSWLPALHLKGDALAELGRTAEAIKAFDDYLGVSPMDSDMLTVRGGLKAESGDKKGAEADYRAALKYIPDYQPALDGLKSMGAGAR